MSGSISFLARPFLFSRFCAIASLAVLLICGSSSVGLAQDFDSLIDSHVAAGEFGPATKLANSLGDVQIRDRWLGNIAGAQALAGARRASVNTASYIDDDSARSGTLSEIGSAPIGSGASGGAAVADFDSLIELITTTVAPESWDEVGGPGTIDGFEGGVYVDGEGVLKRITIEGDGDSLATIRNKAADATGNTDVRKKSSLRKFSLTRLEKQAQLLKALGRDPDDVMKSLAGIYKIQYVLIYPETGDIVLAGPAGDWHIDPEGRKVNTETGKPVLNLDDLVVCLRNAFSEGSRFGCSITPRKENLAATKEFLANSKLKGAAWRNELRKTLGKQDIEVYGVDRRTRVSRVMIEADYRMKLVGMGLEDGTAGVTSYLNSAAFKAGEPANADVIRWWFALNYDALTASKGHDAFELRGQGVKVLSENELLTERGERVHTGKSEGPTLDFAHSFTKHFDRLADKYPIYAELRNVFDLALVAALVRAEDLPGQVDWHMTHFLGESENDLLYEVELGAAPKEVDTVMNHRVIRGKRVTQTIVGVSGGVAVDTNDLVKRDGIKTDNYGLIRANRSQSKPGELPRDAWWWD